MEYRKSFGAKKGCSDTIASSRRNLCFADVELEIVEKAANDPTWQVLNTNKAQGNNAIEGDTLAEITFKGGILYPKGKIWIPNYLPLQKLIIQSEYHTVITSQMGMNKTIEIINRNFYWPHMAEEIEDYVRSCNNSQWNKVSQHKRYDMLHPLKLSYALWDSISMDFITHLPVSEGCFTVWIVVNRFTMMALFICHT